MQLILSLTIFLSSCYTQRIEELESTVQQLRKDNYYLQLEKQYSYLIEYGPSRELEHIQFTSKGSKLLPSSYIQLDQLATQLNTNAKIVVRIICHTDDLGSQYFNYRLAQKRLYSMRSYLMSKGVHRKQIMTLGLGERWPLSDTQSWLGRNDNRRIEIQFSQL